jgi:hypothetical protein
MTIEFNTVTSSQQKGVIVESFSDYAPPEDVIRLYLSAITGIDKTLVRKRWLNKVGKQPDLGTDWIAVGVEGVTTWGTPYSNNQKIPDIQNRISQQTLKFRASFYGLNSAELSDKAREGLCMVQNNNQLKRYGLTIQSVDDEVLHLPDLQDEQWVDRYDLTFRIGRSVSREYGIRTIVDADAIEFFIEKGKI